MAECRLNFSVSTPRSNRRWTLASLQRINLSPFTMLPGSQLCRSLMGVTIIMSVGERQSTRQRESTVEMSHVLEGEAGRAAGEPCEAMKSASCLSAQRLDELPPFFVCSWISTSSSSLNDYTHKHRYEYISTEHTIISVS
ncbi:hypothetical protein EYF80_012133 [Liparis tanakae]|uniref:Uncharacterized protein n=1 Tax=Liparis tanakae TaxID=230148 RepID=A0A4Z2IK52_9TELE|nr:hypothetical protein EYF80_012133 [Liparis tanakae]